jgi:hypothetical protein
LDWGFEWYELNHIDFTITGTYASGLRDCNGVLTNTDALFTINTDPNILVPSTIYGFSNTGGTTTPISEWMPYDASQQGGILGGLLLITFEYRALTNCSVLSNPVLTIDEFKVEYSGRRMFDANGDALIDLSDYREFAGCIDGPSEPKGVECSFFDRDGNNRVDLTDFAAFQNVAAGP